MLNILCAGELSYAEIEGPQFIVRLAILGSDMLTCSSTRQSKENPDSLNPSSPLGLPV